VNVALGELCFVCGQTIASTGAQESEARRCCPGCGANPRESELAKLLIALCGEVNAERCSLEAVLPLLAGLRVGGILAQGPLRGRLASLPQFTGLPWRADTTATDAGLQSPAGDWARLALPTSSCDLVVSDGLLTTSGDPYGALPELRRILRPGGLHVFLVADEPAAWQTGRTASADGPNQELLSLLLETGMPAQPIAGEAGTAPAAFVAENVKLDPNDERYVPEGGGETGYEHCHRYRLAETLARGKTVLDIASGEGYGSALLAGSAKRVIGVDVSPEAVAHAQRRYGYLGNLEFREGSCAAIPCASGSVDLVVSFETIEHTTAHEAFLAEIRRVLRPDGVLIISSPNKQTYSDASGLANRFHQRELYRAELEQLLRGQFQHVGLWGQRLTFASHVWALDDTAESVASVNGQPSFAPGYFLAVCSRDPLALPALPILYTPASDELYQRAQAGGEPREQSLTRRLKRLERQLAATEREVAMMAQRLAARVSGQLDEVEQRTETRPAVSIVIPVFNRLDLTQQCLAGVAAHTDEPSYELVVVDNASTDGTAEFLRQEQARGRLRLVRNESNLGFARACNQGAAVARADHLLFLNNDTVPKPGWLRALLAVVENDERVAAVGAKLTFPDGTLQHAGVAVLDDRRGSNSLAPMHIYYRHPANYAPANEPRTYQALTAACLLVRRSAFEAVGGYDEGYWNGYEDVDLCFKMREKDWLLVYQPGCELVHYESQSGPERFLRTNQNTELLHRKWLGKVQADLVYTAKGELEQPQNVAVRRYAAPGEVLSLPERRPATGLVSIVILAHNQLTCTRDCLASVERHTDWPHELVLVDNGSDDGTTEYLQEYARGRQNVRLVRNLDNRGFAAGNNQALALAKGDYLLLLNNDTVVTPGWLDEMLAILANHPEVGIIGPMSNRVSGPQLVAKVPYRNERQLINFVERWRSEHAGRSRPVTRLVGFCLLFRREVLQQIGGLDERFGSGNFEDDDFCLRARLAGFQVRLAEGSFVHHLGGQTFKGARIDYRANLQRNWQLFKNKWGFPANAPLAAGYGLPPRVLSPAELFVPLPAGEEPGGERDQTCGWQLTLAQADEAVGAGRLVEALLLLREAARQVPAVAQVHAALGSVLLASGDAAAAALSLAAAVRLEPAEAALRNQFGVACVQAGNVAAGEAAFVAAVDLQAGNLDALLNLAELCRCQRRFDEAATWLQRAVAVKDDDPNVLLALAQLGLDLGEVEAGRVALARLQQVQPDHPAVGALTELVAS
jgi:GT2 family glycosyltransferase/ubiquinone/menaquinone biosynthesis C-methylase UbiE/Tfp pilus assembly protein PilF